MAKPNSLTTRLRAWLCARLDPRPDKGEAWCVDCPFYEGRTLVVSVVGAHLHLEKHRRELASNNVLMKMTVPGEELYRVIEPDSLGEELYAFLIDAYQDYRYSYVNVSDIPPAEWRMHPEWEYEIRNITTASGYPVWQPPAILGAPDLLLGYPLNISREFGVPTLVPRTVE